MTFERIMAAAGVEGSVLRERKEKGWTVSSLSFRRLRHSFNSARANAEVSQEFRQKLTGHFSAEMEKTACGHEVDSANWKKDDEM